MTFTENSVRIDLTPDSDLAHPIEIDPKEAGSTSRFETRLIVICCLVITTVASINSSYSIPFYSVYAISRGISSDRFSLVEGIGDGIYVFGYLFYCIVRMLSIQSFLFE
jgi:hypothetical protein